MYITLSTLFVVLFGLTVALIIFTPLKSHIPGYGEAKKAKEYEMVKVRADSIEQNLVQKQQYMIISKSVEGKCGAA